MGIVLSMMVAAAGAILLWAVDVKNNNGVDWNMIGGILLAVGIIGVILSMIFWASWGGFGRRRVDSVEVVDRPTTIVR